jgi:hypothetical protein
MECVTLIVAADVGGNGRREWPMCSYCLDARRLYCERRKPTGIISIWTPKLHAQDPKPCLCFALSLAASRRPASLLASCDGLLLLPSALRCLQPIQLLAQDVFERFITPRQEHDVLGVDCFAAGMAGECLKVAGCVGCGGSDGCFVKLSRCRSRLHRDAVSEDIFAYRFVYTRAQSRLL